MKNLIISRDTYSWVKFCAATIAKDPNSFEVIIICSDDKVPIHNCPQLCKNAIYEQRKFDLFKIGKQLGVKRLYNLNYKEDFDIDKLTVELQLRVGLGFVQRVYYQNDRVLSSIFDKIKQKTNIEVYSYNSGKALKIRNVLSTEEILDKINLRMFMVGIPDIKDLEFPVLAERFFT